MGKGFEIEMYFGFRNENGYSARLYGKSSMSIYVDGKKVFHTCSRNVNTEDEVMELLANYPEFAKMLLERGVDDECISKDN